MLKIFISLKNLPTTWGLSVSAGVCIRLFSSLKNLPTTWGLRLLGSFHILLKFLL